jgi:nucleoside-diphosphate-sugar epimerase
MGAAIAGRYHVVEEGSARVQPIDVEDATAMVVGAVGNPKARNAIIHIGGPDVYSYKELGELFGTVLKKDVNVISLTAEQFKKQYFNSDVIVYRVTSDSVLPEGDLEKLKEIYPGLELKRLADYLNNPDDPMLKALSEN